MESDQQISVLHYAAQNYAGYLSLLVMYDELKYPFDVNQQSGMKATPLHFAVIFREIKNVELLLKLKANVNLKDKEGRTPLHLAVIRLCAHFASRDMDESYDEDMQQLDDEIFLEFKIIMKELLFNGADRSITSGEGLTA